MNKLDIKEEGPLYSVVFDKYELKIEDMISSYFIIFNEYVDTIFIPCKDLYEYDCDKKNCKDEYNCKYIRFIKNGDIRITRSFVMDKSSSFVNDMIKIKDYLLSILTGEDIAIEAGKYIVEKKVVKYFSKKWKFKVLGFEI